METEKGLRFKLLIFRKYKFNFEKYRQGKSIREFYLQKRSSNDENRTLKTYEEILSFIDGKDIDKERFYYIYFELAEELYGLERYDDACKYFKIAIDNVISPDYRENKFKFKSKHFKPFMKNYHVAVDCFLKAGRFNDGDYYDELNMYNENAEILSNEHKAEFYAQLGGKDVAIKYYEKVIDEIDREEIVRLYDYDPYTNGYFEEKYKKEVAEKNNKKRKYLNIIRSL